MWFKLIILVFTSFLHAQDAVSQPEINSSVSNQVQNTEKAIVETSNQAESSEEAMPEFNFENVLKLTHQKMLDYPIDSCFIIEETLRVSNNNLKILLKTNINPQIKFLSFLIKRMLIENYTTQNCNKSLPEYYSNFSKLFYRIQFHNKNPTSIINKNEKTNNLNVETVKKYLKNYLNGETLELESGDIVLSTSNLSGFTFLRTFTPYDSLFTHVSIVHKSLKDSKINLISMDFKNGASIEDFYMNIHLKNYIRFIVLRPTDKAIAQKAAEKAYNFVSNLSNFERQNIFDPKFDLNSKDKFYCSEYIFRIFNQIQPNFFTQDLINKIKLVPNSLPSYELEKNEINVILPINFINSKNLKIVAEFELSSLLRNDQRRYESTKYTSKYPVNKIVESFNYLDQFLELIWPYRNYEYFSSIYDFFNIQIPYFQFSKYSTYKVKTKIEESSMKCLLKSSREFYPTYLKNLGNKSNNEQLLEKKFQECFNSEILK